MAVSSESRPDTDAIGTSAARAVLWNYASFASGKMLVLITMAVLARLLTPEEFGMVGFATLVVAYLAVMKDLGFGAALIQRRNDVEETAQTVWIVNLILGALLTAAAVVAAPLVAAFFREPLVTPILRVLAFTFVLEALGSVHLVLLRRNLDFKKKMIPDVGRALVKGVVSVSAAVAGFGVWALVWGQLAGVLTAVFLSWAVVPWRPRLEFHRRLLRPLARFGLPLLATDIEYAIWANLDYVVVGRMLGDTALGIYTLAYRLPELLIHSVWRVLANAIFPFFSTIQEQPDLVRKGFLATIRYTQAVIVPLSLGLLVTAEPAVETLFGHQWHDAVPVLRVMALFSLIGSIGVNAGDVYKAMGRTDVLAKLATLELAILVPALLYGARFGIVGVAWAHAAVATFDTVIRLVVARHMVGVGFSDVWRQIRGSLGAGLLMSIAALGALQVGVGFPALMAATVTGAIVYSLALWRFDGDVIRSMVGFLRRREDA